ncbi:acyl carrier protein [Mycobacterium sp. WUMAC-067]|uniref:acyl carrier protein n=1 Tax=unclassified Mycobacterium TaxID=2642494 RepID=UPI001CDA03DE|nr:MULTISPECIES: acyl carrier protein [unclassified Mycobacterium]MCA2245150.1 acyl carrier protein [Mycobacterium sp. WUMAC-067]MCA2316647.1 acyl carrier protein [Mycobacterium sp. WUMAC-025]
MASSNQPVPSTVDDQLVSILRDDLDLKFETLTATTRLIDDLGMDSVAFAAGLVAIEERFGAQLSEEDLLTCTTVGDLQAVIAAGADA